MLEKASKSVRELVIDINGQGREVNETVKKVFCRLNSRELSVANYYIQKKERQGECARQRKRKGNQHENE